MIPFRLEPLDHPGTSPFGISARLRGQLAYFASATDDSKAPVHLENVYTFDLEEVARWLEDGAFSLVSPLDTANRTEVELTEEQEALLSWLLEHRVTQVLVRANS